MIRQAPDAEAAAIERQLHDFAVPPHSAQVTHFRMVVEKKGRPAKAAFSSVSLVEMASSLSRLVRAHLPWQDRDCQDELCGGEAAKLWSAELAEDDDAMPRIGCCIDLHVAMLSSVAHEKFLILGLTLA